MKRIVIKMKNGKYQSYCSNKEYIVFAKMTRHKDGGTSLNFGKTVTFSNLPEYRQTYKQYAV